MTQDERLNWLIKYLLNENPKATYACINLGQAVCPDEIEHQSICMNADIYKVVSDIIKR